jgi:hypothetical protein
MNTFNIEMLLGWFFAFVALTLLFINCQTLDRLERENAALQKALEECRAEHEEQVVCWGSCEEPENAAYHQRWADHCRRALEGKETQP